MSKAMGNGLAGKEDVQPQAISKKKYRAKVTVMILNKQTI